MTVVTWFDRLFGRTPERLARERKVDDAVEAVHDFRKRLRDRSPAALAERGRRQVLEALKDLRERDSATG